MKTITVINELQDLEHGPPKFSPLQRLLAAILARALDDALHRREAKIKSFWVKKDMQKHRKCALRWLLRGNIGHITLEMVCAGLAEDPDELQAEIVRVVKSGHDRGCLKAFGLDPDGMSYLRLKTKQKGGL